jgi:hypothetical protein
MAPQLNAEKPVNLPRIQTLAENRRVTLLVVPTNSVFLAASTFRAQTQIVRDLLNEACRDLISFRDGVWVLGSYVSSIDSQLKRPAGRILLNGRPRPSC